MFGLVRSLVRPQIFRARGAAALRVSVTALALVTLCAGVAPAQNKPFASRLTPRNAPVVDPVDPYSVDKTDVLDACTPGNIIQDGGLETSNPGSGANAFWASTSTNFGTSICSADLCGAVASASPRTGTFW